MGIRWSWVLGWVIILSVLEVVFVVTVEDTGFWATVIALAAVVVMLSTFSLGLYLIGRDSVWKKRLEEEIVDGR